MCTSFSAHYKFNNSNINYFGELEDSSNANDKHGISRTSQTMPFQISNTRLQGTQKQQILAQGCWGLYFPKKRLFD